MTSWHHLVFSALTKSWGQCEEMHMPVVVAFVSQKGGVGKSTLARALLAVAAHGMKVRLADLDPKQGSVLAWEATRRRNASAPTYDVASYRTVGEALAAAADVDLLIIDTPGGTGPETLDIARASHLVVQPTGASADDLVPAVLSFHELVRGGVPSQRLVAAVCRVLTSGEEAVARAYVQHAGYAVLDGSLMEKSAYRTAQNRGQAVTETNVGTLNHQADALMESLLNKVSDEVGQHTGLRQRRKK
jgi:chromosome partitioning protein